MNWNLNVQRQFGRDYMVELAYVGSRGRQITLKTNLNQAPPILGVTTATSTGRRSPSARPPCVTWAPCRARAPSTTTPSSSRAMRRFSNGFSALVSYTFGKTIDLTSDNDGGVTLTNIYEPQLRPRPRAATT